MKGNVMVGQSGGPTAAINSSLAGVYRAAREWGAQKVYGMLHGVQGLMEERYIDLSEYVTNELDIEFLKRTPAAYLGSCRCKLPEAQENTELYEKIFRFLNRLEIEIFIYIGGNDSMDTIKKLSDYAAEKGYTQKFMGCPKTVDNDLALTDHTPGYGSAAKYIGTSVKEIIRDNLCLAYKNGQVTVIEIMGRNAGWLTGAAALAKGEDCAGPDLIYLPELVFDPEDFLKRICELLKKKKTVIVAVSEGIRLEDGRYVCELGHTAEYVDAFGHRQLTGTAAYLAGYIAGKCGCKTRAVELSTLQRAAAHCSSQTDVAEAYEAGRAAVRAAAEGHTGQMIILKRLCGEHYRCEMEVGDIHKIANDERLVPRSWVNEEGTYVTEEFMAYVRPLIQGEIQPVMVDGLPRHLIGPAL